MFKYGDWVRVTGGFYDGLKGRLVDLRRHAGIEYEVSFTTDLGIERRWIASAMCHKIEKPVND